MKIVSFVQSKKLKINYYLLGEELNLAVLHLETLLDESSQLTNALGLLAKNILGAGGQNDDFGTLSIGITRILVRIKQSDYYQSIDMNLGCNYYIYDLFEFCLILGVNDDLL